MKGSRLACELIRANQEKINWYIFGNIGDDELDRMVQDNLYKTGRYERGELPGLLEKYNVDLVCILSVCPETFCYTISESLLCGIPVLVNDLGALGERVRKNGCGILVDASQGAGNVQKALDDLLENPGKIDSYRERIQNYRERTVEEMCKDYTALYEKEAANQAGGAFDAERMFEAWVEE